MQMKPARNQGLTLPFRALRRLREAGIFARAGVSLEYQQLAKRYVVRGVESGGAIDNLGHYVTFCGEDGTPLAWLHPLDGIGVNGVHALVVARVLVRVEMFRRGQTYDVLIARFAPGPRTDGCPARSSPRWQDRSRPRPGRPRPTFRLHPAGPPYPRHRRPVPR